MPGRNLLQHPATVPPPQVPCADEAPGAPLHIVVVDDFQALRDELVTCLSGPGRRISSANSGRQLDVLLRGHHFDMALLDVNLPGESGYAIATRLRARYPQMLLVMITAHGQQVRPTHPAAYDAVLPKPVDLAALDALISGLAPAG